VAKTANLEAEDCGTRTDNPGSGDGSTPPVDDPGYECHWEREYRIWYWPALQAYTWEWTSSWEISCGWETLRAGIEPEGTTSASSRAPMLHLTMHGTGALKNGRTTSLTRTSAKGMELFVDTTLATAADIENAIAAASGLDDKSLGQTYGRGMIMGDATASAKTANGANSRGAKLLKDLMKAPERANNSLTSGRIVRTLEVDVEKKSTHRIARVP
jgi:hypothetical protein